MKILITSGGTKVPIDPVRSIANMSTGKFGASIAKQALLANHEVIYLTSMDGKSPFVCEINALEHSNGESEIEKIKSLYAFKNQYASRYDEFRYHNFHDYAQKLKDLIETYHPEVIILAAAVSDYVVKDYSSKKIKSDKELTIFLEKAPKIISQVKLWQTQCFLVGFKLLIDASDQELVSAARQAMQINHSDLVIANNLVSIQQGAHEILMVEKNGDFKKITSDLAKHLIERIMLR